MLWETLYQHWPQVMAALVAVFWFSKLERTVFFNTKEIERLERSMEKGNESRSIQRKEDMAAINSTLHEMRADIKQLLMRQGNNGHTYNGRDEG